MSTKKEISNNIWEIFRKVYGIPEGVQSEKQAELLNKIVEYVELSLLPKVKEKKHVRKNKDASAE